MSVLAPNPHARLWLACAALVLVPGPAPGADDDAQKPTNTRKVQTVTQRTVKHMNAAHELINAERYDEALKKLDEMAGLKNLNSYEQALVHQMYAYVHSSREEYGKATREFELCLATNGLPEAAHRNTMYNLAQLYVVTEQIPKAIELLKEWFRDAENPSSEAYVLLGSAYGQIERYREAIPPIRTGIEKSPEPKEAWYQLLLGMHYELKEYRECAEVLLDLLRGWPERKRYYQQLAGIYRQLDKEDLALAVSELAHLQGFLVEGDEMVALAQLYLYREVPYKAARVLDAGLRAGKIEGTAENFELAASAWYQAQEIERSIEPLERAASLSKNGNLYVRLAQFHLEAESYGPAVRALESALRKGDLGDPGNAHLLLGIARFHREDVEAAEQAFTRAKNFRDTRRAAEQWLRHISQRAG